MVFGVIVVSQIYTVLFFVPVASKNRGINIYVRSTHGCLLCSDAQALQLHEEVSGVSLNFSSSSDYTLHDISSLDVPPSVHVY